jgi:uncharacterized membrane protein
VGADSAPEAQTEPLTSAVDQHDPTWGEHTVTTAEQSVEVAVPIHSAYNQWTQFEEFPEFMEGVESVTQLTDTKTAWVNKIGGVRREFEAEITEQLPDERVAWTSTSGVTHAGVVTFHRIDDGNTRVMLQLEMEPDNAVEKAGEALGVVARQAKKDMERFKEFIESRGAETGAWRGQVPRPQP